MWVTKKKQREEIARLQEQVKNRDEQIARAEHLYNKLMEFNLQTESKLADYMSKYPFEMGQVVYDLQLRSSKGRFTKTKAARAYSLINDVVVDTKNYFNLVNRYHSKDVFINRIDAEKYLDSVCVE